MPPPPAEGREEQVEACSQGREEQVEACSPEGLGVGAFAVLLVPFGEETFACPKRDWNRRKRVLRAEGEKREVSNMVYRVSCVNSCQSKWFVIYFSIDNHESSTSAPLNVQVFFVWS